MLNLPGRGRSLVVSQICIKINFQILVQVSRLTLGVTHSYDVYLAPVKDAS